MISTLSDSGNLDILFFKVTLYFYLSTHSGEKVQPSGCPSSSPTILHAKYAHSLKHIDMVKKITNLKGSLVINWIGILSHGCVKSSFHLILISYTVLEPSFVGLSDGLTGL